jgi:hypothetical protein
MGASEALAAAADGMIPLTETGFEDLGVFVITARTIHRSEAKEVCQESESVLRRVRFGVKLYAPDR